MNKNGPVIIIEDDVDDRDILIPFNVWYMTIKTPYCAKQGKQSIGSGGLNAP